MSSNKNPPNFGRFIVFIAAPVMLFYFFGNMVGEHARTMLIKQVLDGIENLFSPGNANRGMYILCIAPALLGTAWFVARRWIASWEV